MAHDIDGIAEIIKTGRANGRRVILLVGAGCSASAGIPTGEKLVEIIKKNKTYSWAYNGATDKNYQSCMGMLSEIARQDLIGKYIDRAKLNWAHIAIGQLVKHGFVDRVLTTNFDPLIAKACALVGEFPAIYDLATSKDFRLSVIPDKAVFYLHGQRSGFKLLNTKIERSELARRIAPIFSSLSEGRTLIVVGYSGAEVDPVYQALLRIKKFEGNLYWIGYKQQEPLEHVKKKLLKDSKYAYLIKGLDADAFFVNIASKLNCFPPTFVQKPFTHLKDSLTTVKQFSPPEIGFSFPDQPGKLINEAIQKIRARG